MTILFCGQEGAVIDITVILFIWGGGNSLPFPVHRLDRLVGTNSLSDCKQGGDPIYLLLPFLLLSPGVPVRSMPP